MKILFIHQGFPGQFKNLVPALLERRDQVFVLSSKVKPLNLDPRIHYFRYVVRRGNTSGIHSLVLETESKVIRAEALANEALRLRDQGLAPDLIYCHPGWGESLFLRDIWPHTPQLHYVEFAYNPTSGDSTFKDIYQTNNSFLDSAKVRMKNANTLLNLDSMNWGVTPTHFQKNTLPHYHRNRVSVIHDGIDTSWASPDNSAQYRISDSLCLTNSDKVLTFVNRTFEPYRGIHTMMRSIPLIQEKHPDLHFVFIGKDSPIVSYGANRQDGKGWFSALRDELGTQINWDYVHLTGKIPHESLRSLFRISSLHVYLTYPFVLSWSLLEAMSCGCLVLGSRTEPVQEVIRDGFNGFLVDFHDPQSLAEISCELIRNPEKYIDIRFEARKSITGNYELAKCLRKHLALVDFAANVPTVV